MLAGRHHLGDIHICDVRADHEDVPGLLCTRQLHLFVPVAGVLHLLVAGLERSAVFSDAAGHRQVRAEEDGGSLQLYRVVSVGSSRAAWRCFANAMGTASS